MLIHHSTTERRLLLHPRSDTELELALWMDIACSLHHGADNWIVSLPFLTKNHGNFEWWDRVGKGVNPGRVVPGRSCTSVGRLFCTPQTLLVPILTTPSRYNQTELHAEPVSLHLISCGTSYILRLGLFRNPLGLARARSRSAEEVVCVGSPLTLGAQKTVGKRFPLPSPRTVFRYIS